VLSDGYVQHSEVLQLVQSADAGVIPNLPITLNEHALPTKLFEYVMLDVPVVAAGLPTMREHFAGDEVLFYRAGDVDALAAALTDVARDRPAATARAARARARYEQYRWRISARRYAAILAASAEPAAPPPVALRDVAQEEEGSEQRDDREGAADQGRPDPVAGPAGR
jgi:glycosyltransferase involved in cell wall biosynthesis